MYIGEDYGGPFPPSVVDRLDTRRELSRIIDSALAMLDQIDTDPDLEPDGDELDQSGPEWSTCAVLAFHDCTLPHEDDEEGGDAEPLLGWREGRAGFGGCPTVIDDAEDDGHSEPVLASPETTTLIPCGEPHPLSYGFSGRLWGCRGGDQSHWAAGCANDREKDAGDEPEQVNEDGGDILDEPHDEDDSGIGDEDGVWEQVQRA